MDAELRASRISVSIHALAAIAMGWLSAQLAQPLYAVVAAIVVLIVVGFAAERMAKKKGLGWWVGNGLVIYLFIWLTTWTYFFNVALA